MGWSQSGRVRVAGLQDGGSGLGLGLGLVGPNQVGFG